MAGRQSKRVKTMDIYQAMDSIYPDAYIGVDALTYTAKTSLGAIGIHSVIERLSESIAHEDTKPFKYNGASGWSKGPVAYASKVNMQRALLWSIVMVRGPLAQEVIGYKRLDLKATRVDLRVDVRMATAYPQLARLVYDIAVSNNNCNPRLIEGFTGSTFYPDASREATYYGRLYDKSQEYGCEQGEVWRYEVEIKRTAADEVTNILLECHDLERFVSETVFGVFSSKWSIPTPKAGIKPKINYAGVALVSPEHKLDWLRRNVAPSVAKLRQIGMTQEVLTALGLYDGLVESENKESRE